MDLAAISVNPLKSIDTGDLAAILDDQEATVQAEFQNRTAAFYFEQEALQDSRLKDLRAEFDAKVREFRGKEKAARNTADKTDDMSARLQHVKEARKWKNKAEDEEIAYRQKRGFLQEHAEDYLTLIEASLAGERKRMPLFRVRWRIEN